MSGVRPNTFKVVQLNAENLFLYLDSSTTQDWKNLSEKDWQRLSHATVANKPLSKTLWLAESLLDMDADIVCINEVGGLESLNNFNQLFLQDRYTVHLIEGNSDRGIDIGYLVKKGLPLACELHTHKDRPLHFLYPHERPPEGESAALKSHYFSRDCAELRVFTQEQRNRPALILLLVHLKSKLDPENIDPQGKERRRAEFNTLMRIYRQLRTEFQVPVIIAGDFNGSARREARSDEFSELNNTDLESVLDLAGLSDEKAATQVQFSRGGGLQCLQIDYMFVSPELKEQLFTEAVEVYRYRSDLKVALPLPQSLEQRTYLPSDHYPVVAVFRDFLGVKTVNGPRLTGR
jgi:exonuclease III